MNTKRNKLERRSALVQLERTVAETEERLANKLYNQNRTKNT